MKNIALLCGEYLFEFRDIYSTWTPDNASCFRWDFSCFAFREIPAANFQTARRFVQYGWESLSTPDFSFFRLMKLGRKLKVCFNDYQELIHHAYQLVWYLQDLKGLTTAERELAEGGMGWWLGVVLTSLLSSFFLLSSFLPLFLHPILD